VRKVYFVKKERSQTDLIHIAIILVFISTGV
jgi:hypothetical protein